MEKRNSEDMSRGELIYMIAILRGVLYDRSRPLTKKRKYKILDLTAFDISDEDEISYDNFDRSYYNDYKENY